MSNTTQNTSKQVIVKRQSEVILISELDVKNLTPMSANKVTTSLINYILLAQDMEIKKLLGPTLYAKLLAEWVAANYDKNQLPDGTGTIPPIIVGDTINYVELYEQLYKPLIWWSYLTALPNVAIKVEEAGIMLNSTDYSESSGLVGLDRLVAEGSMIARQYTEYLKEYICETFSTDATVNSEKVDTGGVSIGIFIPKRPWNVSSKCCR